MSSLCSYSPVISTQYSEVFWTMMDPVPLPQHVVDSFKGKIMAVVGYETDQVSCDWWRAYNHHYCAYMSGALSEMKQVLSPRQFHNIQRRDIHSWTCFNAC